MWWRSGTLEIRGLYLLLVALIWQEIGVVLLLLVFFGDPHHGISIASFARSSSLNFSTLPSPQPGTMLLLAVVIKR